MFTFKWCFNSLLAEIMSLLAFFNLRRNCTLILLGTVVGCYSLDIYTNVDIMTSQFNGDLIIITCSVSSSSFNDVRQHYIHLHCPLLGHDEICYSNCESVLFTSGRSVYKNVLSSCEKTWQLTRRVEFQYVVNRMYLETTGPWYCVYMNKKSSNITIQRYKSRPSSATPTTVIGTTLVSKTSSYCNQTMICPAQSDKTSLIASVICALSVSAICNVLLAISFCIYKYENIKSKRRLISKQDHGYPTEIMSMLSKNLNRPLGLNASSYSRTPSLDSPSNKDSLSTYIQDTLNASSFHSPSYYVHPEYRIVNVLSPNNDHRYNIEGPKVLLRQNSDDLTGSDHAFSPAIQKHLYKQQRRSSQLPYSVNSPQNLNSQQKPFLIGRSYNSHQQLPNDSNDESGLGSESFCNYNIQKQTSFVGGSDTVDLIHHCDANLILETSP